MENQQPTLEYIKRLAKKLKKEKGITHTEALEQTAKLYKFSNWIHCQRVLTQREAESIKPVEPVPAVKQFQLTFTDWLKKHSKRDSPLGDLAADMLRDKTWPLYETVKEYESYLMFKGAAYEAIQTLKQAFRTYKAYVKRKSSPNSITPKANKKMQNNSDTRRVTTVKNATPIHYAKRTAEKFIAGDKAWISFSGTKAWPVTVLKVDDRNYSVRIERPLSKAGGSNSLFLDEVRSTPELACMNRVTS